MKICQLHKANYEANCTKKIDKFNIRQPLDKGHFAKFTACQIFRLYSISSTVRAAFSVEVSP